MYLSVRSDEYQHLMTDSPTVTREMRKRSVELGGVDPNLHAGVTAIMCGHYARQSRFFYIFRKYRHGDRNPYVLYGMVAMVVQIDKSSALVEALAGRVPVQFVEGRLELLLKARDSATKLLRSTLLFSNLC